MNRLRYLCASAVLSLLLSACSSPHGQPQKGSEPVAPDQISDFATLYSQNCAGCHGAQGRGGAAIALSDPVYLAIVDQDSMRKAIANGVRGTSMPAFAQSAGGMLTNKQLEVITSGISRVGGAREFSTEAIPLPIRQERQATPSVANLPTEPIARPATALKARAAPRAVLSPTILSWLSSAIRDYAPSSSLVALS